MSTLSIYNNASREAKVTFGDLINVLFEVWTARGTMPVVMTSSGLIQRTFPYAAPIDFSFSDAWAAFNRVRQYNPMDEAITGSVTGTGTITLGLPGAPGPATGSDKSAFFNAILLDVAKSANIAPAPITLDASGAYEDGSAWALPSIEFGWTHEARDIEHILVLIAEETQRGPRMRTARLTTSDFPAEFLGNGAAAMVAGDQLTINVTAAAAGCVTNAAVVNAQHYAYDVLTALFAERVLPDAPAVRSGAQMRALASPTRAAVVNQRIGSLLSR